MSNTSTRDVIELIASTRTQQGLSLRDVVTIAHSNGPVAGITDTIAAQFATFISSPDQVRYVDVEALVGNDELTVSGQIKIITDDLVIRGTFQTENNVYARPGVSATARRRSDITAVTVSGASAPKSDTEPWPENVEVTLVGKDLQLVFPARSSRGDSLGKLIPGLLT